MIIDCLADLHGHYPSLEGGDLLIIAGDLTARDTYEELAYFERWCEIQNYKKIIVIGGNHDHHLQSNPTWLNTPKVSYLYDSGTDFEGFKIWGSPWSLKFPGINPKATAFCMETEEELKEKWDLIPYDTDILITHTPAWGVLDQVKDFKKGIIRNCGSKSLTQILKKVRPSYHIFGHIHEQGGMNMLSHWRSSPEEKRAHITCINASYVNEYYVPTNPPVKICHHQKSNE